MLRGTCVLVFPVDFGGQGHGVQGMGEGIECQSGGVGVTIPGIYGAGWSQGSDDDECLLKAFGYKLQGKWAAGHVGLSGHIPVLGCRPGEDA